ncbi:MAG: AhpC/TSA family protein [Bacteroidetes bacterium]|nr:MAG: AhpC/TSA family protein [Bacteroidota bacterium]
MSKLVVDQTILQEMRTNQGNNLWELSQQHPVLLVFLRHFGCTFCREALADIAQKRKDIEASGTQVVFVHMTENKTAERYFSRYELQGVEHISDPECHFYAAFGLVKGTFTQLFGLHSWIRGFQSAVLEGHGVGFRQLGDGFQMPGVFVIHQGEIKDGFIHKLASSRPDYLNLVSRCCTV